MQQLAGKVAIVTGGGQGSGRGAALALAREGAAVALVGRTLVTLQSVADEIASLGGRSLPVVCDVGDVAQIRQCVQQVVDRFGTVDILVNTAQSPMERSSSLLEISAEDMQQLWQTGPVASLEFMRACHPWLRGKGSIINFGSGAQFAPAQFGVYAGAKAAIQMITRAAAEEWGPEGIRANLIIPFVMSPAAQMYFEKRPEEREAVLATIPLRRFGDVEQDLGGVVVFLASDASRFITGQPFMLDGGQKFLR